MIQIINRTATPSTSTKEIETQYPKSLPIIHKNLIITTSDGCPLLVLLKDRLGYSNGGNQNKRIRFWIASTRQYKTSSEFTNHPILPTGVNQTGDLSQATKFVEDITLEPGRDWVRMM